MKYKKMLISIPISTIYLGLIISNKGLHSEHTTPHAINTDVTHLNMVSTEIPQEIDEREAINVIALEALSKVYGIDSNIMEVSNNYIHEGHLEVQGLYPLYIINAYPVSDNTANYVVIYSEPHGKIIEIRNSLLALQSIEPREVVYNQSELEEVMQDDTWILVAKNYLNQLITDEYNIVGVEFTNESNFHTIDIKLTLDNEDSYFVHLEYPDKSLRGIRLITE